MDNSIGISNNQGDVIGVGVDGNGNVIWKNVSIVINEIKRDFSLSYLSKEHLEIHSDTEEDFKGWLKGFALSLPSIYQKKEYRREKVISHIKSHLEEKNHLLLLGESGTSKSTLLMETMCDYLEKDYRVLYSFGNEELKNEVGLCESLEELLKAGNKLLVVVDNAHDKKTSLIFNIISNMSTLSKKAGRKNDGT